MVNQSQFIEMFGNIPQDKKLAEISEIYDGVHQTPHYTDSGIKFISVEDISDIYGSKKYISIEDYNKYKHVPELGDLIMTRIGTIGLCAVVSKSEPLAYYVSVTLIKPNHNIIDSTYLKYYIESGYGQNELRMRSLLEAFPMKINLNEIGKVAVKVPSVESQLAFVQIVHHADKSKFAGFKSQFFEMTKASNSIKIENVAKDVFAGGDKPKDHSAVQSEQYKYPVFSNGIGDNALLCFSKEGRVKEAAITVSARGTIGYAECREAGFTPVVRLLTLIPKEGYQLAYLKFALNSITFHSTGSSQGQLTAPDFCKYEIPNAPFDVQVVFGSIVQQADKSKYLN